MSTTRRQVLLNGLLGAGYVGLRALATGLPIPFLLNPRKAMADDTLPACVDKTKAQYLIVSLSQNGDPVNANAPGTYDFADIAHSPDPEMAKATFTLGGKSVSGAAVWGPTHTAQITVGGQTQMVTTGLPQSVLDRTCFFHHATLTTIHPDLPKVQRLMGDLAGQEMLPSVISRNLAQCFGTVQPEPVSLVGVTAPEYLTYQGRTLPDLNPTGLRDMLTHPAGPLTNLQGLRDSALDKMYAVVKNAGTATPAQKAYVDSLALSRSQARSISDQLLNNLLQITANDATGQIIAATTLLKMNVTPVAAIHIPFGGDNHFDTNLTTEATQHITGVGQIAFLQQQLQSYGMQDQVSFLMLNVFGRTLKQLGLVGRNHWASHHTAVLIGKPFKAGVIGGLTPMNSDYFALDINSQTGAGQAGADVPLLESLSALGKTVGAAVGVSTDVLNQNIMKGKVVTAALA